MRLIILTLGIWALMHVGFDFDWMRVLWTMGLTVYAAWYDLIKP
jgi:hypothetical protein